MKKQCKTGFVMSAAIYYMVQADFTGVVSLGEATVAGFERPVPIYTIHAVQAVEAPEVPQERVV